MVEVPARRAKPGWVLVQTAASQVSVGTERQPLDLARKSFFGKALARPDLVREVVTKAVAEGIGEVWRQALGRLNVPIPWAIPRLGRCSMWSRRCRGLLWATGSRARDELHAAYLQLDGKCLMLFLGQLRRTKELDLSVKGVWRNRTRRAIRRRAPAARRSGRRWVPCGGRISLTKEGAADKVIFTGLLVGRTKLAAFARADLFVLPS